MRSLSSYIESQIGSPHSSNALDVLELRVSNTDLDHYVATKMPVLFTYYLIDNLYEDTMAFHLKLFNSI